MTHQETGPGVPLKIGFRAGDPVLQAKAILVTGSQVLGVLGPKSWPRASSSPSGRPVWFDNQSYHESLWNAHALGEGENGDR